MFERLPPHWLGYAIANLVVPLSSFRLALLSVLGEDVLLPFIVAVWIAAWYGGLRPGLFTAALCVWEPSLATGCRYG
jgi:hypothetical protein